MPGALPALTLVTFAGAVLLRVALWSIEVAHTRRVRPAAVQAPATSRVHPIGARPDGRTAAALRRAA